MLSKTQKRAIVFFIALLVSLLIWYINASWGNMFLTCLILSTTTFLIIYSPFEIYFCWRDIWYDRWERIYLKSVNKSNIGVEVEGGILHGNLLANTDQSVVSSKNTIVIFSHGFSDIKEKLQYYYLPLAHNGYVILTYDARGIGESKKAGKRSDFLKLIDDYNAIIQWIKKQDEFASFRIYSIGTSIGAIIALCAGLPNPDIKKIVAISSISNYKLNIENSNAIVKFSYFLKGINLFPNENENEKLSPNIIIDKLKERLSGEEWALLSKKVFLIHSRNDKITPFYNFEEIKLNLMLSNENQLILRKGGHTQKKNELSIVGATLKFLNRSLE
ncbi:MAG TPA: alpha/beta fold hydrolase [Candidatus Lokiarchaeia archaeon]